MRFQHFEIKPDERRLLIHEQETALGARAFDVLLTLASRHGQVMSKQDLIEAVWPDVVVEENNLQVQISTLRKLLGANTITTLPGKGYCLTAELAGSHIMAQEQKVVFEATTFPAELSSRAQIGNLPAHISELYGRSADLQTLQTLLTQHRLITVTGTGGVGKTHLVRTIASTQRDDWPGGVWWLDLTALHSLEGIVQSLAACFKLGLPADGDALSELALALKSKQMLLVLDNCEHVVDATKRLVNELLNSAPDVQVLVTSQLRLYATGEYVYQLGTLSVPQLQDVPAEDALQYGAVQLFLLRVQQLDARFKLTDSLLPDVIAICQQLDGVALAIELAAARVPMLGVRGVRDRLGERLRLLGSRQATIRATLDWSHKLLGEAEALMFRRLGIFVGSFSLEAAKRLLCDDKVDEWEMMGLLENLIHHSLIVVTDDESIRYRMLETHRLYALEKLEEAGEVAIWQRRLAEAMVSLCLHLVKTRSTKAMWSEIDHIRTAYDWAVVQPDSASHEIAITLATASSVVLAVSGFAHEALTKLLKVEPWVNAQTPKPIAARYWQWLGRSGVHGRLPTSRCTEAFIKSEKIFQSLSEWRHVHACRRMRAEALLSNCQFAEAKAALLDAQAMETPDWPIADRMRRIKVQALLSAQTGQNKAALRLAEQALSLAQMGNIERYMLAIQFDIAHLHLRMGAHDQALALFKQIASHTVVHHYHRLTIAQAYAGLLMVLIEMNDLQEAAQACLEGLSYWRSSGLFLKHGDLFAWWLVQTKTPLIAAQMQGAVNAFYLTREIVREAIVQKTHEATMEALKQAFPAEQLAILLKESVGIVEEAQLAAKFESALHQYLDAK